MKRVGCLLPNIVDYENLLDAFAKAAKGKSSRGVVQRFRGDLTENLKVLGSSICDGKVVVGAFYRFVVYDPKCRVIHAASFRERVLHHAIMNICGTHFERGAIANSFACRRGRGSHAAIGRACQYNGASRYFLKMDIRRYFDSIPHDRLCMRFRRLFKDRDLLQLLDRIVMSYHCQPGLGLPIGTLSSQYFANFYLDVLDRFVTENLKCRGYVRYMDDFVLWSNSRRFLGECRRVIADWVGETLGLNIKDGGSLGVASEGLPFLGYRLVSRHVLMSSRGRRRFRNRLTDLHTRADDGAYPMQEVQRRIDALIAFTDRAKGRSWRRRMVSRICSEGGWE